MYCFELKLETRSTKPITRSDLQRANSTSSIDSSKSSRRQRESSSDSDNAFPSPNASESLKNKKKKQKHSTMSTDDQLKEFMKTVTAWGPSIEKINTIDSRMSSIEVKVDAVTAQLSALEGRIAAVERSNVNSAHDVNALRQDVNVLKSQLNKVQQQSIANEFLIHGLPPSVANQDLPGVFENLCAFIGVQLSADDFEGSPRIFTNRSRTASTVIGSFKSHSLKTSFSKAFKAKRPIPCEDIVDLPPTSTFRGKQIVLRNSLTPANRQILNEANRLKGDLFRFAWDVDGRIHLRKDENAKPIEITSMDQLNKVIADARN